MDDRLKELIESLGIIAEDEHYQVAKLIIEDCINIVNKRKDAAIDASWNVDEAMTNAVWDIEEHFYKVWGKQ